MMCQKGLNDVGKRHHIRIWKRRRPRTGRRSGWARLPMASNSLFCGLDWR